MPTVLALGLDPAFVELPQSPSLTPDLVRAFIEWQLERLRALGYEVISCLVDLGDTAEAVTVECLKSRQFDCVVIGAGLRAPERLPLFEKLLNLVHAHAPGAKLCFNTNPEDTAEAVQRWVWWQPLQRFGRAARLGHHPSRGQARPAPWRRR